ncbi:phage head-binding domain-containing protein [Morganella morganii]|uniref:phage head-binding domain-containing protein n=1 Tax=Morganella morganii TaxID=582 RepID=UPI002022F6C3|nr:phage head-binding domain-containing protein [Morganella morganii]
MSENIIPNCVISMPSQLFTLARKFQAASNGKIFIGKIDTDPTIPENQIQVYLENEDGTTVPAPQPLIINQAGYPVYNGQIAKFVTVQGHSMAVYDSYGAQQFYYPNVLKYDPDQFEVRFRGELKNGDGSLIGYQYDESTTQRTVKQKLNEMLSIYDFCPVDHSSISDWRPYFERALVHIESLGGGTLFVPDGKYIINSYSEIGTIGEVFGAILPLCDKVNISLSDGAEIVVGEFFDNKRFQLFFGSSPKIPALISVRSDIVISGGTISFSGDKSTMKDGQIERVILQTGNVNNISVRNVTFRDGDLVNGLVLGYLDTGSNATVDGCKFINLVQNGKNNDHTSVYMNAVNGAVINCDFVAATELARKIACAVELHKSFNIWSGGIVRGYTRGGYINAVSSESAEIIHTIVTGITASVAHQFINYSYGSNGLIADSLVSNNNIMIPYRSQEDNDNAEIFGISSLVGVTVYGDYEETQGSNILIAGNNYIVDESVPANFSTVFYADASISGITLKNNHLFARTFFANTTAKLTMYNCHFYDNDFSEMSVVGGVERALYHLNCKRISYCTISAKMPTSSTKITSVIKITVELLGSNNTFIIDKAFTKTMDKALDFANEALLHQEGTVYSYPRKCNVNISSGGILTVNEYLPTATRADFIGGQIVNGYIPPSVVYRYNDSLVGSGEHVSSSGGDYNSAHFYVYRD